MVLAFSFLRSIQKQSPPSFLQTSTTMLYQELLDGLMAPASNISLMCCLTSSSKGGGMHRKCSLKSLLSSTSILCLIVLVQPSSFLSNENTSWYSWMSSHACCTNSSGHSSRASKFNSFSTLTCLSALVNGFLVMPCSSSNASRVTEWRLLFGILLAV